MPTITVHRDDFFKNHLKESREDEEFEKECADYGLELDDITSEKKMAAKEQGEKAAEGLSDDVLYKIDIPANRSDLLCAEGLGRALRVFRNLEKPPVYNVVVPPPEKIIKIFRKKETTGIRPFVVGAILRDVTFDAARVRSFIDLQDKLHHNIGRRRTLIAIGTHDLDTIEGPFSYEAHPQKSIRFVPLGETQEFAVDELFASYKARSHHLRPFLHITENAPLHPVIYDSKRTLLSLPPIINGEHSKITLKTKNVFIECTGTDYTKLQIVLNTMVAMFCHYAKDPFTVEAVEVIDEEKGTSTITPDMKEHVFEVCTDYINKGIGIDLTPEAIAKSLTRMMLKAEVVDSKESKEKGKKISVRVPCTRADILHACDIQEDVAIAYGFNKIPKTIPRVAVASKQQPLNKLADIIREAIAQAGHMEVLTFTLISKDENYKFLRRPDPGHDAILLANSKTSEFQVARTSILPGLLKTISSNKAYPLPIRIFEVGDTVVQDPTNETGARNVRRLGALYTGLTSGFEQIHGLLDRIMLLLQSTFVLADSEEAKKAAQRHELRLAGKPVPGETDEAEEKKQEKGKKDPKAKGKKDEKKEKTEEDEEKEAQEARDKVYKKYVYTIRPVSDPAYFPGKCAEVIWEGRRVGLFGMLHPEVLRNFELVNPASALELDLEPFLNPGF